MCQYRFAVHIAQRLERNQWKSRSGPNANFFMFTGSFKCQQYIGLNHFLAWCLKALHKLHLFTWNFINFIHSCVSVGCSLNCLLNSSVLPVKGVALGSDLSRFSCSACTCCPFPWSQRAVEESYTPRGFTAVDCTSLPGLKRHVDLKISHTKKIASALAASPVMAKPLTRLSFCVLLVISQWKK